MLKVFQVLLTADPKVILPSVTLGSRRAAAVVKSPVDVLGRGARPEGVTLRCTVLPLPLATPAETGRKSTGKVSISNCCKNCCCC